jgi:GAF domain-containing protein
VVLPRACRRAGRRVVFGFRRGAFFPGIDVAVSFPGQTVPSGHDPQWLTELQALLLSTDGLESFLDEVAAVAVRALPAAVACGVTLQPDGQPRTVAASGLLASQVDEIQYRVDQGPCLEAMRTGVVLYVADLGGEDRWPAFSTAALGFGARCCLSTPLRVRDVPVGAFNLYATTVDAFDQAARALASTFAGYASGAVALALRLARQAQVSADLRAALASRAVIDQALGVIMGQQRCTAQDAFAVLRHASQQRNVKIQAIAAGIVEGVSGQPPRPGGFSPRP